MATFDYAVTPEAAEEGGYLVRFPDVPEAITQGETRAEALARAADALETALEFYVEGGKNLPRPHRPRRGQKTVRPSALACMKLSVYQAMREQHVRKSELARRLGWHQMQLDRLLDLRHASRLDQAEQALTALGKKLELRVA